MVNKQVEDFRNIVAISNYSSVGLRSENQDAYAAQYPLNHDELLFKGITACIADGVSCSNQGQQASHTATTQFISDYYSTPSSWSVKHSVTKIMMGLNTWLYNSGKNQTINNGMVTTFSSLIIKSKTAHLFHVGDSRIYLFREGKLSQLTRDHQRTTFGNQRILTRALGMDINVEIDYHTMLLHNGDELLLSTDGVHEFLSHDTLTELMAKRLSDESKCQLICDTAIAQGSTDNSSCVIISVNQLPENDLNEYQQTMLAKPIPPSLSALHILDHYQVISTLYSGTRSHVYKVKNTHDDQLYVLKALSRNYSDDLTVLKQFASEYWISSQLDNHRIMKMYPIPLDSPFMYQVSEYIEGVTLRQWMYDNPQPALETVRRLLHEIIRALRVFQRADMVHRDLKPENIMITGDQQVKIIDFGTVQVLGFDESHNHSSEDSFPPGSVNYTAPEYINTGKATIISDLFSVAVIGYEILTGQLPYDNAQKNINKARHVKWSYQSIRNIRDDIPLWVDLAFEKALNPNPNIRYQALGDFITDIRNPNSSLLNSTQNRTLRKTNPLLFWKFSALFLGLIAVIEGLLLIQP